MSNPTINTKGTRPSSSSSDSIGTVVDLTARKTGVYRADAISLSISQVMSRSKIDKLNPFELTDAALFPEWYYYFKKNFLQAVYSGRDFCKCSPEDYRQKIYGSGEAIDSAVTSIEDLFHECLTILLENKSVVEQDQYLNRACVENEIIPQIDLTCEFNLLTLDRRQYELRKKAFQGDYKPLLNHLLAYSVSPKDIWQIFRQLFTLSSIKMDFKQQKEFCESITEAKKSLNDISKQIVYWFETMARSKPSWRPMKDTALKNDSRYDMNRTMGNNHHAKASGKNGKQGNFKKKPFKSNSEAYTSAQSKYLNNGRFVAEKSILHMSKNEDISVYSTCTFILDTGSDVHTVNDKSLLTNVRPISQTINIGNPRPVDTIGTLKIQFKDGHQQILPDVYYIPYLPNILSFHGLGDIGLPVLINEKREVINTHTQQVVSGDTESTIKIPVTILPLAQEIPNEGISDTLNFQSDSETQNIFEISTQPTMDPLTGDSSDSESVFSAESISDTESSDLSDDASPDEVDKLSRQWHNTLGHPGASQFKAFKQMLNLPKSVVHVPLIQCRGCCTSKTVNRFAKQSRGHTSITRPFEVIHVDVCGPFDQPKAHDNARYFLTIVDRFSRFVTAIPLARKSETSTMIQSFLMRSYTDLRASHFPKQLRSDNGSEILNDNLKEFLLDKGIDLRLTHPHSSAENGIAERMHRTLQDKARTQMAHGNIPPIFWSEAIRYAAFLLNWTPRVNLQNKAPIHLWYATDLLTCPTFYPFGCTAFVTIPLELRTNKLAPNALECVYLGPDIQRTGHRFFSYDLMKVFGSDQALFRPNEFYFLTYANPITKLPINHNRLPTAYLPGIKIPPSFRNLTGQDLYCDTTTLYEIFDETQSKDLSVTTSRTDTKSVVPEVSTTPLNLESSPMPPRKAAKKKLTLSPSTSVAQLPVTSAPNRNQQAPAMELPSPSPQDKAHLNKTPAITKKTSSSSSKTPSLSSSPTLTVEPRYHTRSVTRALNKSVLPTKGGSEPNARSLTFPDKIQYMKASDSKKRSHANILLVQTANQVGKSEQQGIIPNRESLLHAATFYADNKLNNSKPIPNSYTEAMRAADKENWIEACNLEMQAHYENGTFTLVPLPPNVKPIGCRWVFNIKDKGLYKARLVAKGYTQQEGIDYEETFSPVIKHTSLRLLLAIAGKHKMHVHQMDVKTAFLNGVLKEELYMKQPPGYKASPMNAKDKSTEYVLKLNKSIYGLKQAPLVWNQTINKTLRSLGFTRSVEEPCIYYNFENNESIFIALYVDDMLLIGTNLEKITQLKTHLGQAFQMKDLGVAGKFLGMNLNVSSTGIEVNMEEYINNLLLEYGMADCNPVKTPANKTNLDDLSDSSDATCDEHEYRSIVGKLLYAANTVRYDINYIVLKLSRYLASPKEKHMQAAKRVLRYLKGTKKFGLCYTPNSPDDLICYSDANLASETDTKSRSTTGSVILYGGSPVSWRSKLQTLVALSTVNSELFALCFTTQECVWLQNLMKDIKITHNTKIYCDNQPAIKTVQLEVALEGTKHIRRRVDFIKQQIQFSTLLLQYVPTKLNCADIFTKALPDPQFTILRQRCALGIRPTDLL